MTQNSARDARTFGYVMVLGGVLVAGMAVDRIFFHKGSGLRWLTAATALIGLAGGAWMIIKRRAPLDWIDHLAMERWGWLGSWFVTAAFLAIPLVIAWLLSPLN